MFCSKCGKEVPEGAAFCANCGSPVGGQVAPSQPRQAATPRQATLTPHAAGTPYAAAATKKKPPVVPIAIAVVVVIVAVAVIAGVATGGFGMFGGSGVQPKGSVEEYTWAELSAISDEIGAAADENTAINVAKKYNLVGEDGILDGSQRKSVTLSDGTQTSVQIAGFAHDDKTGGGKAGITFIFTDAIGEHEMNSNCTNAGGWEASEMRSWLASDGKALLPQDLQSELVAVDKMTNNTGETQDASSVTTTSDELWLFSYAELAGAPTVEGWSSDSVDQYGSVYDAEGAQYKLFRDQHVSQADINGILTKNYEGSSWEWWMRSPYPFYSDFFSCVGWGGDPYLAYRSDVSDAVVPGFCI